MQSPILPAYNRGIPPGARIDAHPIQIAIAQFGQIGVSQGKGLEIQPKVTNVGFAFERHVADRQGIRVRRIIRIQHVTTIVDHVRGARI